MAILFALLSALEFFPYVVQTLPFSVILLPAFVLAIPIVLTYALARCGFAYGAVAGGIAFGGAALLGFSTLPYLAAAFIPAALAASYMITKAKRFRTSFVVISFAALAGAVLAIVILTSTSNMGVVDYAVSYYGGQLSLFEDAQVTLIYGTMRTADLLAGAVTQEAINLTSKADAIVRMQEILRDFLNVSIVYLLMLFSMGLGYFTYIIPRAYAKREGQSVADMHKFKDYALPKRFWIVAVVSVIASMIGSSVGWTGFDILESTVYSVFLFVFMIQGLSLMVYWLDERKTGKGLKTVLLIGAVILLQTTILPLAGLAENIIGIRKRMQARKVEKK